MISIFIALCYYNSAEINKVICKHSVQTPTFDKSGKSQFDQHTTTANHLVLQRTIHCYDTCE